MGKDMVGGIVIEVAYVKGRPDVIFIDVANRAGGGRGNDTCAIYVEKNALSDRIQIGDSMWWQGPWALWTPAKYVGKAGKCGRDFDIMIPRRGHSGVKHPAREAAR